MKYGLSPRAAIALTLGAKAWSLFFPNNPEDNPDPQTELDAVAKVIIPVLRHRLKLKHGWDQEYLGNKKNNDNQHILEQFIVDFCLATAPQNVKNYKETVRKTLDSMLDTL